MKRFAAALLLGLLPGFAIDATASSISATSCSAIDVQAALNRAVAGDTVNVPAGTCAWTTGVLWTAPPSVTVRGAGNLSMLGGGDATVIIDNYASGSPLIAITTNASGTFRLAGLTVKGGTGSIKENGLIAINGLSKGMRIDHLHINMQAYTPQNSGKPLRFSQWVDGVVDHVLVDLGDLGEVHLSASAYGTGVENSGDAAFATASGFGTSDFIFIEDSQFNGQKSPTVQNQYMSIVTDCNSGGRFVVRYNTIYSAGAGQTHPTGGGQGARGCRAHELYGNTASPLAAFNPLTDTPPFAFSWMSSGVSLVWGNTSNGAFKQFIHLDSMRKDNTTYPETGTPGGWGYCGTSFSGTGSAWDGNANTTTGYPCLDQPGRGRSDLLSGAFPSRINATTGTIAWPHQALEPVYEWLNTFTAVPGWGNNTNMRVIVATGAETRLVENRDYYLFNASFNGTTGVGVGPRSLRPSTCTAGVAYWSTDQGGNWNATNGNANDGTLDVCTAPNTWTNAVYTPYAYPHPLTQGILPSPPSAPTNLHVVR